MYAGKRRGRPPRLRPPTLPSDLLPTHEPVPAQIASPAVHTQENEIRPPAFWSKGQLLNVRHAGAGYRVTLMGEEYDPRYPHRCLEFDNGFECQQFVSNWYARQSSDPRAG